MTSPSMRRVWIEIKAVKKDSRPALKSPSMRRVWIEIRIRRFRAGTPWGHPPCGGCGLKFGEVEAAQRTATVTLHAEGVD